MNDEPVYTWTNEPPDLAPRISSDPCPVVCDNGTPQARCTRRDNGHEVHLGHNPWHDRPGSFRRKRATRPPTQDELFVKDVSGSMR